LIFYVWTAGEYRPDAVRMDIRKPNPAQMHRNSHDALIISRHQAMRLTGLTADQLPKHGSDEIVTVDLVRKR
jgi:hypothetical protein